MRPGKGGHRLYEHAIPSLFLSFPKHLHKNHVKRRSPRKCKSVEQPTHSVELTRSEPPPSKIAKSIYSDHSYADDSLDAVEQLEQLKELQKQAKVLKQKVCCRDKIKNIEQVITREKIIDLKIEKN